MQSSKSLELEHEGNTVSNQQELVDGDPITEQVLLYLLPI